MSAPGFEGPAHGLAAFRGAKRSQPVGRFRPPQRPLEWKLKTSPQSTGECLGLIVAPSPATPPVKRNRHQTRFPRQALQGVATGGDQQLGKPRGEPGIALVLEA